MNTSLGYAKRTLNDTNVLLSGGGDKPLSEFIGSISWDTTNKKITYKSAGSNTVNNLVTFGTNAFTSTAYLSSVHAGQLQTPPSTYNSTSISAGIAPYINNVGTNIFAGATVSEITVERSSNDGVSWVDVTTEEADNIKNVFSGAVLGALHISAGDQGLIGDRLRITFNPTRDQRYSLLSFIYIYFTTLGCTCFCDIERNLYSNTSTWTPYKADVPIGGWSGPNVIGMGNAMFGLTNPQDSGYGFRFTFRVTGVTSGYSSKGIIYSMQGFTANKAWGFPTGNSIARYNAPYSYLNADRAVQFDNTITSSGFIKTGATDNDLLLGGGGHTSISTFTSKLLTTDTVLTVTARKTFNEVYMTSTLKWTTEYGIRFDAARKKTGGGGWASSFIRMDDPEGDTFFSLGAFGQDATLNYIFLGCNVFNGKNLRLYTDKVTFGDNTIYHAGNLSTMVASGSSHKGGLVPDTSSTAGTTKFLCEDSTWKVPTLATASEYLKPDNTRCKASSTGSLTYFNSNTSTVAANTDGVANPTNEWYHHIAMVREDPNGYFFDMAFSLTETTTPRIKYRVRAGNSYSNWIELVTSANSTEYNVGGTSLSASIVAASSLGSSSTNKLALISTSNTSGTVNLSGNLYVCPALYVNLNGVYFTSDKRLKENITECKFEYNIFEIGNPIHQFTWKNSQDKTIGFIAQEVEKWCPEAVGEGDNKYKTVNYNVALSGLCSVLYDEIKTLKLELKLLKEEIKNKSSL